MQTEVWWQLVVVMVVLQDFDAPLNINSSIRNCGSITDCGKVLANCRLILTLTRQSVRSTPRHLASYPCEAAREPKEEGSTELGRGPKTL